MKRQFIRDAHMLQTLHSSLPQIRIALKESWDNMIQPVHNCKTEYFHRVYDANSRQMIDIKYHSMKEIVENVYYNIVPDEKKEHFLVKRCDNNERGIITSYNE
jgi:hypothetical protein